MKKYVQDKLQEYADRNPVRYHMPGHKGKTDLQDVTELSETDDLNNPETFLRDAQKALSKSYGSAHSFFMVNGTTGSVQAMIKYVSVVSSLPILIQRNSHKSVLAACMLFNVDTIVFDDIYDDELQAFTFDESKIIDQIKNNDISAVFITSVDYFGRTVNLRRIAEACKEKSILLLCDEAHGAHFHISEKLPGSAAAYADICAHSPHKTLSALTQCSYMHISHKIDTEKITSLISGLQTSSPSFILMKSMDNARYDADTMQEAWETRTKEAEDLEKKLNGIKNISVKNAKWAQEAGYSGKDPTRLVIDVGELGSGIEIGRKLEGRYDIFMEMYSFRYITGILTPWDGKDWDKRLYEALKEIAETKFHKPIPAKYPKSYKRAVKLQDVETKEWKKIGLIDAAWETAAVSLGAYPPGVPAVLPGEIISEETIKYLLEIKKSGGSLFGVNNGYINCIKNK